MDGAIEILLLEDVESDAELIGMELARSGLDVDLEHVRDREAFVAALEPEPPDVILADYSLPDVDGPAALSLVEDRCPEVPFIFVSGAIGEERAIELLRHGATDYVLKGNLSALPPSVRRAMAEVEERRQRRRAEEALRSSQARLSAVLEIAPDAIVAMDSDRRIRLFNQAAELIFGYRAREVEGEPLEILIPVRHREEHRRRMEDFAGSSEVSRRVVPDGEFTAVRKNGTEFPAEGSMSKFRVGGEQFFTVIIRDVTVEKKTRRELREAHARLERSLRERTALLEVNNAIIGNLDRESLLEAVVAALRDVIPHDRASLALLEDEGRHLRVAAVREEPEGPRVMERGTGFPVAGSHLEDVIHAGSARLRTDLAVDDTDGREEALRDGSGIRSYVSVPLVASDDVLGVLNVGAKEPDRFDDDDAELLLAVGRQVALAVENMLAFEEIQALRRQLELQNEYLREEVSEARAFGEIVGDSPAIRRIERRVEQVAPTGATVLIQGESGTGKELVAREIHRRSDRGERPLIKVNCASVPRDLYESEFFGHVRGAFTGATRDRPGRFAAADGGTLFLDEVGEIPPDLQPKLLRVLQEGKYERVGEERTREVDVRILAATNRDLEEEVEAGRFREDLFYRLAVFPIEVPPLREREEDIEPLSLHFLEEARERLDRPEVRMTRADLRELESYRWPGNVRELRNVIERAVITARDGRLRLDLEASGTRAGTEASGPGGGEDREPEILTEAEMRERERENIRRALERADGKIYGEGGAAELLGIPATTLASRVKSWDIPRPDSADPSEGTAG